MDPDANLKEQLEISREFFSETVPFAYRQEKAERLAELVLALNEWIEKGGFLPSKWHKFCGPRSRRGPESL
jgi:hypothetical protein